MYSIWKNTIAAAVLSAMLAGCLPAQNGSGSAARIVDENPMLSAQAGMVCTLLFQDKIRAHAGYGFTGGLSFCRHTAQDAFLLVQLNYQQFTYAGMQSALYDAGSGAGLNLNTSMKMSSLEFPLLYGMEYGRISGAIGLETCFLLSVKLDQEVSAAGSMPANALAGKYHQANVKGLSSFYAANVAPCLYLSWAVLKRLSWSWMTSCNLLADPVPGYSYVSPYRFIQNKFVITFKMQDP